MHQPGSIHLLVFHVFHAIKKEYLMSVVVCSILKKNCIPLCLIASAYQLAIIWDETKAACALKYATLSQGCKTTFIFKCSLCPTTSIKLKQTLRVFNKGDIGHIGSGQARVLTKNWRARSGISWLIKCQGGDESLVQVIPHVPGDRRSFHTIPLWLWKDISQWRRHDRGAAACQAANTSQRPH